MNRIVLDQPHATLVVIGEQRILTYDYPAAEMLIGQRLIIHAGLKIPVFGLSVGRFSIGTGPSGEPVLMESFTANDGLPAIRCHPLPLGAVVATAVLANCVPVSAHVLGPNPQRMYLQRGDGRPGRIYLYGAHPEQGKGGGEDITDQLPYGDFTVGRWAWLLDSVEPVTEKCPRCRGSKLLPADPYLDHARPRCPTCDGLGRCDPIPDSIIVPDYNTQGE